MECNGSGHCLIVEKLVICNHECKLEKCPNFNICGTSCPRYILEFNSGLCFGCFNVGILGFQEEKNWYCGICTLGFQESVKLPKCSHKLCIECVKKIYYPSLWDEMQNPEPEFPYPELEEEYFQTLSDTTVWTLPEHPKLSKWRTQWYGLSVRAGISREPTYIRHCPFCRI